MKIGHLSAYPGCLSADDAGNESVQADEAWLSSREADWSKIEAGLRSRLAAPGALRDKIILSGKMEACG